MQRTLVVLSLVLASATGMGQVLWSDDFANPGNWIIAHDGPVDLDWQIGVDLQNTGLWPMEPVSSTTAANGYAMLDSDGFGNMSGSGEQAHMTTSTPIDLSANPNVLLQFETHYWHYFSSRCFIEVSTNNTDWEQLTMDSQAGPNVFPLFGDLTENEHTENPLLVTVDISGTIASNPSTVWIRFYWTGEMDYSWFVDDVAIVEQTPYDLIMGTTLVSNAVYGIQHGSIPTAQQTGGMTFGTSVWNQGYLPQSNVLVELDVQGPTPFNTSFNLGTLAPGDTIPWQEFVPLPTLSQGIYTIVFTATSDESSGDSDPLNNSAARYLAIDDAVYALDGLNAIPAPEQVVSSIMTSSFFGAEDGLLFLNYFEIHAATDVLGYEVLLAPTTVAGSQITFALYDTLDVWEDLYTIPFCATDTITVSAADVAAGQIQVFCEPGSNLPPGGYFLVATVYSSEGQYPIGLINDETIEQHMAASLIRIPDDGLYFNGHAFALRMLMGDPASCVAEFVITQSTIADIPIPFELDLVNTSYADAGSYTSLWEFGDGATSTEQYPTHDYATNGPYWICLTIDDGLGCTDQFCDSIMVDEDGLFTRDDEGGGGFTIHVVPEIITSITDNSATEDPVIWPNPVIDVLNCDLLAGSTSIRMSILDLGGRLISATTSSGAQPIERVDVSSLAPGAYVLRIEHDHGSSVLPFVKATR